ncbi:hypothetical protein LELG_02004 [Lodderomyces elongisporus NRRL YB-4239]|uniref:Uncharacterized protein n=1 Tax=Lodderomyces elongisporus (strain ATCC 11503 / CBS 2605 / JCM 1781 / NBRC 1676 / NRRL YB-4239) TaxID=379508 RepID=A5DXB7_LODEL|nr:hypothetical protein LELG_02004 [Lodderomyces elongisporus NRRL YB-4239]
MVEVQERHKRSPDFNERYYICRGSEGFYSNFNITVKYSKDFSNALLANAIKMMIRKNSWLAHNFFKEPGTDSEAHNGHNWTLRIIKRIVFDEVVSFRKIERFDKLALEQLNEVRFQMDVEKPLWKIIVWEEANNEDKLISVCFDHSQYDGLSGVQFQKDLSKEMALLCEDDGHNVVFQMLEPIILFDYERDFEYLPKSIMGSAELATDLYTPPVSSVIDHHLRTYLPLYQKVADKSWWWWWWWSSASKSSASATSLKIWTNPEPVKKDLSTAYEIFKLDAVVMEKLMQFCRSQKVTLTTLLDIVAVKALQNSVFKATHGDEPIGSDSYVAINGRRYYSEDIQNFKYGTMVCGHHILLPPIENLNAAMQEFSDKLCSGIKSRNSFKEIGMMQFSNAWKFLNNKIGKVGGGRPSMTISNLGKVQNSNDIYQFKDMYFGANAGVMYNFVLNCLTLPSNEMTIIFAYLPQFNSLKLGSTSAIEEFSKLFIKYINEISQQSSKTQ